MPELPEVEIIRRNLVDRLKTRQISDMQVLLPRLIKWPAPATFQAMAIGKVITDMKRRGKYLLIELENGVLIVIHLRMTGRLCCVTDGAARDPYARIIFCLDDGTALHYADTRTLGTLYALRQDEIWRVSGLANMGPEPLTDAFTALYLQKLLKKSRAKIKSILLNQKYIGGLGNIYVDESLILARIHPEREGASLRPDEIERLRVAINRVIADGIDDGGTTFRDYRDGNGGKGSHQQHLLAYGRGGLPCLKCGGVIEKIVVGGRGTHYCPNCQSREG